MRLLRAGIAVWAFVEAWRTGEMLMLLPGSIFALQAIFDIGCCGSAGCAAPGQRSYGHTASPVAEEAVYEEIK